MDLQSKLENILPFLYKTPDAELTDAFAVYEEQIRELQKGRMLYLGAIYGWVFVIGAILLVRSDMPAGNKHAGTELYSLIYPTRL
jgi:hypothetical protein